MFFGPYAFGVVPLWAGWRSPCPACTAAGGVDCRGAS
ncbi:protein of unknown function [Candidatus Promineifilum breve]|uniref:Uncharacterized protein n=1 Tax=Candidatus Promineifilum breve TaxID=1806508 RepID=A0A160T8B1_9CHLR|nr:protein of unknown function [Candidatus Promineifilum breve]